MSESLPSRIQSGFLARFPEGAILDEVQRCPQLLSWLQGLVDERQRMGDFVVTGSAQFSLIESITQSLAGRLARVELLPLSASELRHVDKLPETLTQTLFQGEYPTLYDRTRNQLYRHLVTSAFSQLR
jgi:predicted AAA+ superfamily ATPase